MPSDPRYPIGKFEYAGSVSAEQRDAMIAEIAAAPGLLRAAVRGLSDKQLDTPYRDGGWTVRQVVHHVPDSHLNAYVRFKLTMTEDQPTIRPYDEKRWASLPEASTGDINVSLSLLDALHERWVRLLRSMAPKDFARKLNHPESGIQDLNRLLAMYAWHGRHHAAHVTELRKRMNW